MQPALSASWQPHLSLAALQAVAAAGMPPPTLAATSADHWHWFAGRAMGFSEPTRKSIRLRLAGLAPADAAHALSLLSSGASQLRLQPGCQLPSVQAGAAPFFLLSQPGRGAVLASLVALAAKRGAGRLSAEDAQAALAGAGWTLQSGPVVIPGTVDGRTGTQLFLATPLPPPTASSAAPEPAIAVRALDAAAASARAGVVLDVSSFMGDLAR